MEVKLPPAVKEQNKLNLVLVGPQNIDKNIIANYMAQEHQRCIIRLDQLLPYWQNRGHAIAEEANKFLEEKAVELKTAQEELEAKLKK